MCITYYKIKTKLPDFIFICALSGTNTFEKRNHSYICDIADLLEMCLEDIDQANKQVNTALLPPLSV